MNRPGVLRRFLASLAAAATLAAAPAQAPLARIDPPAAPGSLAPELSHIGDTIALTWLEPAAPGPRSKETGSSYLLRFSRLEHGSWAPPATIVSGTGLFANWADIPAVADAGGGRLLAHWTAESSPDHYDVVLARSEDGGRTWRRTGRANSATTPGESGMVSLLPEGSAVRAAWLEARDGKATATGAENRIMTLRTALVRDRVESRELLDERVCECCQTAAALTSEGPVVAYRDRSEEEIRDIAIVRRTAKGWSRPRLVASDGWKIAGCPVDGPSAAASGRAVAVAWYTAAQERPRVFVAFSSDAGATFGRPVLVDGAAPLGRVEVVLDEDGDAIVGWAATEGVSPAIRLRRVCPTGRAGVPLVVAPTSVARTAGLPRIARADANLFVTWVEPGEPARIRAARLPLRSVP